MACGATFRTSVLQALSSPLFHQQVLQRTRPGRLALARMNAEVALAVADDWSRVGHAGVIGSGPPALAAARRPEGPFSARVFALKSSRLTTAAAIDFRRTELLRPAHCAHSRRRPTLNLTNDSYLNARPFRRARQPKETRHDHRIRGRAGQGTGLDQSGPQAPARRRAMGPCCIGQDLRDHQPSHRTIAVPYGRGRQRRCGCCGDRRAQGVRSTVLGRPVAARPHARAAEDRRKGRAAHRRAGRHRVAGQRHAAVVCHHGQRGHFSLLRRLVLQGAGHHPSLRRQHAHLHVARAAGRVRPDHPVERAGADGLDQAGQRAVLRQHADPQAGRAGLPHLHPAGRAGAGNRPAAGRRQRAARLRPHGRRGAFGAPGRRQDRLHRLHRGRQADRAGRHLQPEEGDAGAGRQGAKRRVRRRRHREARAGRRQDLLRQLRAGVLGRHAPVRAGEHP